jgi:outer membrane protein OmpA-like peptidoglycan-associated protein
VSRAAEIGRRALFAFVSVFMGALAVSMPGHAANSPVALAHVADGPEDDFRIIEITLRGRRVLAADVIAYERGDGLMLPLAELMLALGFAVDVDAVNGTANGWFLRETQRFALDLSKGEARVADHVFAISFDAVETDQVELFLPADALSQWFDLALNWQPDRQILDISPSYLLPDEEAARRAGIAGRAASRRQAIDISGYTAISARPGLISSPAGALTLGHLTSFGTEENRRSTTAGISLTGDLLYFTADLTGSLSDNNDPAGQMVLSRRDVEGRLLGPLRAQEVRFGDLALDSAPLIGDTATGVGISIARERFQRGSNFDTTRIEGSALPGWQAELYRDGQLLSFQTVPAEGRFAFEDVPLLFGANRFTVELYGPAGERQSVERTIDVAEAFLARGQFEYALQALKTGAALFSGNALSNAEVLPGADTGVAIASDPPGNLDPDWQGQARFSYGLTTALTASAAVLIGYDETERSSEARFQAGLAGRAGRTFWTFDAGYAGEGTAMASGLRADLGPIGVTLSDDRYSKGFLSARTGEGDSRLSSRTDLRLDGRPIELMEGVNFNWALGGSVAERFDGRMDQNLAMRVGGQFSRFSVNNAVNWRSVDGVEVADEAATEGIFNAAGEVFGVRTRVGFDYSIAPEFSANRFNLNLSQRRGDWFYSVRADHDLREDQTGLGLGLARDWNGVRLGLDLDHREDAGTDARLSLSLNFDRGPDGGVRFGRAARGQRGSARARVFHDANVNGTFDDGEDIFPQVRLVSEPRGRQSAATHGRIALEDLPVDRETGVTLDKASLPDPYLTPSSPGVRFTARPGASVRFDLPVIESGEIEWLLIGPDGKPREGFISSLTPCGLDAPLMRERSAFDGLVLFQFVPPGCYVLSAPGHEPITLQLSPGEVFVVGASEPTLQAQPRIEPTAQLDAISDALSPRNPECSISAFAVYFEFDQASLSLAGKETLRVAAERAQRCGIDRIRIEGHADRAGPTAYNQALSERRARGVRDVFIGGGVAAELIETAGLSEHNPARPTKDGIAEPLNRRAEIVIYVK